MALTKIGSIGINTGIQFAGVTTIATLNGSDSVLSVGGTVNFVSDVSIGGTVSIAGTLTYEDVTNIDAVGLITARNGVIVGSGITLSKDGDIFATGVTTATTFVGALTGNVTGNISGGTVSGSTGTFTSNVTVGGNISIPDKIIHTDDTNTSIRFPAADKVTVETSGTERLAIEPAGNVNISKSVNVGAGLTVGGLGAGTSTSAFIGQGHIELTRDAGNAFIDFKDAFADDFDARIIASSNQLQFFSGGNGQAVTALTTGLGKVGIATDTLPSISKLEIHSDKLGGVAGPTGAGYTSGNSQELLLLKSPDVSNSTTYRFTNYRHTNGTTHVSSEGRLRRHVDATDMGFIGFGDGYVNFGYGTAEKMRINNSGILTKPYTPSFSAKGSTDAISASSPLPFDSVSGINHNNGNHYSTTTYKFTCPVDGYYYVTCHVVPTNFDVNANVELYVADNSGNRHFLDRKVKTTNYASNNFSVGGSRIIYKTATSTLWVEFNSIAGSPTLEGSSHFGITLIA